MSFITSLPIISWIIEFENQWPVLSAVVAVVCTILVFVIVFSLRVLVWTLTHMYLVEMTDQTGQKKQMFIDMPPGIVDNPNVKYINPDKYEPDRKTIHKLLLLILLILALSFYSSVFVAIKASAFVSPMLIALITFVCQILIPLYLSRNVSLS